jgi:hypothetical protein
MARRVVRSVAENDAALIIQDENTANCRDVALGLPDCMALAIAAMLFEG